VPDTRTIDVIQPTNPEVIALRIENEDLRKRLAAAQRQLTEAQDYAFNLLTQLDELQANGDSHE
jgi:regulator of replication initiation timing